MTIGHTWHSVPEDLGRDVDGYVRCLEDRVDQVPERMEAFAVAGDAAALAVTSKEFAESMAIGAVDFAECRKEPGAEGILSFNEAQEIEMVEQYCMDGDDAI